MFYRKEYSMSIDEATDIRNELALKVRQIEELEEQRDSLSGAAKGKVTRQITPLAEEVAAYRKALKGAPPAPMNPAEAWNHLTARFHQTVRTYEERIAEWQKDFAADPTRIIERGEMVVEMAEEYKIATRILKGIDRGVFLTPFHALAYVLALAERDFRNDMGNQARRGSSQSTNAYASAVKLDEVKVKASWLDWDYQYIQADLARLWDAVVSYYQGASPQAWEAVVDMYYRKKKYNALGGYRWWLDEPGDEVVGTVWAQSPEEAERKFRDGRMWSRSFSSWEGNGFLVEEDPDSEDVRAELERQFYEETGLKMGASGR